MKKHGMKTSGIKTNRMKPHARIAIVLCSLAAWCIPFAAQTAEPPASTPDVMPSPVKSSAQQPKKAEPATVFPGPAQDTRPRADIIFTHANVYTGVPDNAPFASIDREEAIAVRGDRIQAVGKTIDIFRLKGPQTQIVDLGGHFVMAGFNDAHLHLSGAGLQKLNVDLVGVKSLEEMRERVRARVEN